MYPPFLSIYLFCEILTVLLITINTSIRLYTHSFIHSALSLSCYPGVTSDLETYPSLNSDNSYFSSRPSNLSKVHFLFPVILSAVGPHIFLFWPIFLHLTLFVPTKAFEKGNRIRVFLRHYVCQSVFSVVMALP